MPRYWNALVEKNFDQNQKLNWRNNRWFCRDLTRVSRVMHTIFPVTVMLLEVVNKSDVSVLSLKLRSECSQEAFMKWYTCFHPKMEYTWRKEILVRNKFGILKLFCSFWYALCTSTITSVVIIRQVLHFIVIDFSVIEIK